MLNLLRSKLRALPDAALFAVVLVSLCLVSWAVYGSSFGTFFTLDDFVWLRAATHADVPEFFRDAFSFPAPTPFVWPTPGWRPLVDLYFFAGWRTYGLHPLAWHLTNALLHGLNASLVVLLAWRLSRSRATGLLAGLLFVVLPTYDVAVSWVSSVAELFAGLFYLLTLLLYAGYLRQTSRRRWFYIGAFSTLLLGLLTKESTITIVVVLAALVVTLQPPADRKTLVRRGMELVPFAALTLAYFIFQYNQQYTYVADIQLYRFDWHAWASFWDYVQWIALPLPDRWAGWVPAAKPIVAAAFLAAGCAAVALRSRVLAFAFVWTLVALVPYVFFLAPVSPRYTYLACIPASIFDAALICMAASWLAERFGAVPVIALAAVVLAATGFLGVEAHHRQSRLDRTAQLYSEVFHQVPDLCGGLPPQGHIYLVGSPVFNYYAVNALTALNLEYDDVYVDGVLPDLVAFIEPKCVLQYDGRAHRYTRAE